MFEVVKPIPGNQIIDTSISIVMPVYNEEGAIAKTVLECQEDVLTHFRDGEIICVDDASTDRTTDVLQSLQDQVDSLHIERNQKNLGHGPSLRKALVQARGDLVFCIDSDYQFYPREFWSLYELQGSADIVIGYRSPRRDGVMRRLASYLGNRLISIRHGSPVRDINIPFKLFPRQILRQLLPLIPEQTMIPSTLLILAANRCGIPIQETPVSHLERSSGICTLSHHRFAKFSLNALRELVQFRRGLQESER